MDELGQIAGQFGFDTSLPTYKFETGFTHDDLHFAAVDCEPIEVTTDDGSKLLFTAETFFNFYKDRLDLDPVWEVTGFMRPVDTSPREDRLVRVIITGGRHYTEPAVPLSTAYFQYVEWDITSII